MARRKKGSSRKRPLVFTESPVEASRHYPSPVFSARNPIGADVVSVKEKQQSWVSPQIDPNAPYTPPRRHQSRRCRAACALDPTQTQRPEIARKETAVHYTSLQFMRDKGRKQTRDGQISRDDSSSDLTLTEINPLGRYGSSPSSDVGLSPKARSAKKRRPPVVGHGIAGSTRTQRRQSQSGRNRNQFSDTDSVRYNDKENARVKDNKHRYQTDETSSDEENVNLVFSNDNGTCSPNLSPKMNVKKSQRVLRTHIGTRISHTTDSNTSCTSQPNNAKSPSVSSLRTRHLKLPKKSLESRSSKHRMNDLLSGEADCGGKERCRQQRSKTTTENVLAFDTPEAEYGITVSLRRRRRLLPTPAKNKLMMCL